MEASAVVCARGVVRAGCVAAGGAAVVARPLPVAVALLLRREGSLSAQGVLTTPATHRLRACRLPAMDRVAASNCALLNSSKRMPERSLKRRSIDLSPGVRMIFGGALVGVCSTAVVRKPSASGLQGRCEIGNRLIGTLAALVLVC